MSTDEAAAPSLLSEALQSYYLLRSSIHERGEGERTTFRFDGRTYERQDLADESAFAPGSRLATGDAVDLYVTAAWLAAYPEVRLPDPEDDEPLVRIGYFRTPVWSAAVDADPVAGRTLITFQLIRDGSAYRVDRDDLRCIHPEGGELADRTLYLSASYLRELGAWSPTDGERQPDVWHEIEYCAHLGGEAEVLEVVNESTVTFALASGGKKPQTHTVDLHDPLSVAPFPVTTLYPQSGARGRVVLSHFFLTRGGLEAATSPTESESPAAMAAVAAAAKRPRLATTSQRDPIPSTSNQTLEHQPMKDPKHPLSQGVGAPPRPKRSKAFLPPPEPKHPRSNGVEPQAAKRANAVLPPPDPKHPTAQSVETPTDIKRPMAILPPEPKHPVGNGVELKRPMEILSPPDPKYPIGNSAKPQEAKSAIAFLPPPEPKHPVSQSVRAPTDIKRPIAILPPPDPKHPVGNGAGLKRPMKSTAR